MPLLLLGPDEAVASLSIAIKCVFKMDQRM